MSTVTRGPEKRRKIRKFVRTMSQQQSIDENDGVECRPNLSLTPSIKKYKKMKNQKISTDFPQVKDLSAVCSIKK